MVLSGIVLNDQERSAAEQAAASATGVGRVDNQLRVMATNRRFASTDAKL